MKITVGRLKTIIQEELDNFKKLQEDCGSYKRDEEASEEEGEADLSVCEAEQTEVILDDLRGVLERWEETEYDSDEERWQAYAKDVQDMIDQYEAPAPEEHTEEECEEVHPDQEHEEWEAEQEEPEDEEDEEEGEGEEDKESKPKKSKKKGSFPYESKQLEQMVYQKLITALGG